MKKTCTEMLQFEKKLIRQDKENYFFYVSFIK